ncbi:iron uptake transporter deferrochelatase/peroxidase subunit [Leucobacter sp. UT-8R-CII-1-4]|uniref:iron uptake transporter deferrochelatase/peroxidase subunit n=1 Tax=Leucobacter sp. UT-8R-CII-1-4 TaxID=3040075 RepID=UPI0024A7D5C0|nr:iron uptake transporter deferrochelatase/peroxidase subunit [Leucobacter sp. UT-8R-CII-1-4]MDI6022041.1 iron uptake transporter deferrochelatase/peroxidase subunit [Leucobacter sp. UT-8R-CII-1-4]
MGEEQTEGDKTAAEAKPGLSRRALMALVGTGAAGLAAGAAGAASVVAIANANGAGAANNPTLSYPFYGKHQAGIVTPAQDRMHFAAFDLAEGLGREELIELLSDWTYAASRITQGLEVSVSGAFDGSPMMPPDDTGEAVGISPAGLTVTFGFGKSLFETADGIDRFGLAAKLPKEFTDMPKMKNDFINRDQSDGDICIQACSNDPQVAVHAIRNLTRIAFGRAQLRWSQLGFGRTSSTSTAQETPRNLFGQKDGTMNLHAEEPELIDEHVWISGAGSAWSTGGSYLVARRINMTIEVWDGVQLGEQERVTGRNKRDGAPLSGGTEFSQPDFTAKGEDGQLLVDERSHVARVHPDNNDGIRMLRRGYNFVDGNDAQGRLNAGLFFIAFVSAPEQFAKVHQNMARDDLFVEYLKTTASSVFLVPPGMADGEYVGQQLFTA